MRSTAVPLLLFLAAVGVVPHEVYAVSYSQTDYDFLSAQGWENVPPEILAPDPTITAGIGNTNPTSWSSGVVVSPNWVITAKHVVHGSDGLKTGYRPNSLTASVTVDGTAYKLVQAPVLYPNGDLALLQIRNSNGTPANLPAANIPRLPAPDDLVLSDVRQRFTFGGVGNSNSGSSDRGVLRWSNTSRGFSGSPNPLYLGSTEVGDSGSGGYVRDGWDWQLRGVASSSAADQLMTEGRANWIASVVGAELPVAEMAKPQADVVTTNGLIPDPGIGQSLEIVGSMAVGGVVPELNVRDIYLNGSTSGAGSLQVSAGAGVDVIGAVFVAPDLGSVGSASVVNGSLSANSIYVGVNGTANWAQFDGEVLAHSKFVVGKTSGSQGTAFLVGGTDGSSLGTSVLALGDEAGSTGVIEQYSETQVDTNISFVGYRGSGTYKQFGGAHTTERLSIGAIPGSSGTYELTGGMLNVSDLFVTGTLDVQGGIATLTNSLVTDGAGVARVEGAGRIKTAGIFSIADAAVATSSGGLIEGSPDGMLVVNASQRAAIDAGALSVVTSGQPIYEVGVDLHIPTQTVIGEANIADKVVVGGAATLAGSGIGISLAGGVEHTAGGTVELGSDLIVPAGTLSQIDTSSTGLFKSTGIFVSPGGSLSLAGDATTTSQFLNHGTLSIHGIAGVAAVKGSFGGIQVPGQYFQWGPSAALVIDLSTSGADRLDVRRFDVGEVGHGDGGVLQLDVAQSEVAAIGYGSEYEIVNIEGVPGGESLGLGPDGDGTFGQIVYGNASWEDFKAAGKALAVLYENEGVEMSQGGFPVRTYDGVSVRIVVPGDFDFDNDVDQDDVDYFQDAWFGLYDLALGASSYMQGDINGDGVRDSADLTILNEFVGTSIGGGVGVPEPSAILLVAIVFVGDRLTQRRRI